MICLLNHVYLEVEDEEEEKKKYSMTTDLPDDDEGGRDGHMGRLPRGRSVRKSLVLVIAEELLLLARNPTMSIWP